MFIEKISDESKKAYLQQKVDQFNADKYHYERLRPVEYSQQDLTIFKERGWLNQIADLKKQNIYFEIYENFPSDNFWKYDQQSAFVVAFGDSAVKTYNHKLDYKALYNCGEYPEGCQNYLPVCLDKTLQLINQQQKQIGQVSPLAIDQAYIREFMLPNLQKIDEEQGTHLVADYKLALANQFAKKKHLVLQNLQKQQDDLGLEIERNHAIEHGIY